MKVRLLLSLLLTLCTAYSWAHDVVVDNIYYKLDRSTKEAIVTFKGNSYTSQTPWYSGDITIPESINVGGVDYTVTYINYSAFYKCPNVTSVTLPNTIKSIGTYAFGYCNSLESVIIPESLTLTTIDNEAFMDCISLKSVVLPNSLEEIGRYCFYGCTSLEEVTIGCGIARVIEYAFFDCPNLKKVICNATKVPTTGELVFGRCNLSSATLYVPEESVSLYKSASQWRDFGSINPIDKCATPTISYANGKISFSCATEGVEFHSSITSKDVNSYNSADISISATFDISVYATKTGYVDSETATYTLNFLDDVLLKGDMNNDGKLSIADVTKLVLELLKAGHKDNNGNNIPVIPDTETSHNGHEFVDLGLSVKWATCNVGATEPEGYGDFFAWGATEPYYKEGHATDDNCVDWEEGKESGYKWENYKWCNGTESSMTKYCTDNEYGIIDNKTKLDLEDDAANANWGGSWRMPTAAEMKELCSKCKWTSATQNRVPGYKVEGPNGNSIFLPFSASRIDSTIYRYSYGYYWSSSLEDSYSNMGAFLYFGLYYIDLAGMEKANGLPIRPVCP